MLNGLHGVPNGFQHVLQASDARYVCAYTYMYIMYAYMQVYSQGEVQAATKGEKGREVRPNPDQ